VNAQSTLLPTQSTQQEKKEQIFRKNNAGGEEGAPPGSTWLGSRSAAQGQAGGRRSGTPLSAASQGSGQGSRG
jgi:hypothetical protein